MSQFRFLRRAMIISRRLMAMLVKSSSGHTSPGNHCLNLPYPEAVSTRSGDKKCKNHKKMQKIILCAPTRTGLSLTGKLFKSATVVYSSSFLAKVIGCDRGDDRGRVHNTDTQAILQRVYRVFTQVYLYSAQCVH